MNDDRSYPVIVPVWSYKGGQGRSWLCANLAYQLAKAGHRCLLVDLDYRAPGLAAFVRQMAETDQIPSYPLPGIGLGHDLDLKASFLEAVVKWWWFLKKDRYSEKWPVNKAYDFVSSNPILEEKATYYLKDIVYEIPIAPSIPGRIFFLRGGDVSSSYFRAYIGEGNAFRQIIDPRSEAGAQSPVQFPTLLYLSLASLAEQAKINFIFLDLPAGLAALTEMLFDPPESSKLANSYFRGAVPGIVIIATAPSEQSFRGVFGLLKPGQGSYTPSLFERVNVYGDVKSRGSFPFISEGRWLLAITRIEKQMMAIKEINEILVSQLGMNPNRAGMFNYEKEYGGWEFILGCEQKFPLSSGGNIDFSKTQKKNLSLEADSLLGSDLVDPLNSFVISLNEYREQCRLLAQEIDLRHKKSTRKDFPEKLVIAGEDVPAFRNFIHSMMKTDTTVGAKEIQAYLFSHEDLFASVIQSAYVNDRKRLHQILDAITELSGDSSFFKKDVSQKPIIRRISLKDWTEEELPDESITGDLLIWALKTCDMVAFPHYLLGFLRKYYRQYIVHLDNELKDIQRALERECYAFEETCIYRNSWNLLPMTLLAKLVVCPKESGSLRRWTWSEFKNWLSQDKSVLIEARRNSISLWYDWNQFLLSKTGKDIVSRKDGTDLGKIQSSEFEKSLKEALFDYANLISKMPSKDQGRLDWYSAPTRFFEENRYKAWLAWSDWFVNPLYSKQFKEEKTYRPYPQDDADYPSQPLEGWGLAITTSSKALQGEGLSAFAETILTSTWQKEWQRKGGSSGWIDVIKDPDIRSQQPWLQAITANLRQASPKAKTALTPIEMLAVIAFVSRILYGTGTELTINPRVIEARMEEKISVPSFQKKASRKTVNIFQALRLILEALIGLDD